MKRHTDQAAADASETPGAPTGRADGKRGGVRMWQVVLLFLFAGTLAWLVAASATIKVRPVLDDEWEGWQRDLERERRR